MIGAKIGELELMELFYEDDPTVRVRANFPFYVGTGTKSTAVVYFELQPGNRLESHTDSAEEILLILEGEVAVVPAMVERSLRNVVVSTFDRPLMPLGQRAKGTPPVGVEEEKVASGDAPAGRDTQEGAGR